MQLLETTNKVALTHEQRVALNNQRLYVQMILAIGNGT